MSESFYNTTHERGARLRQYESIAETQEAKVLEFFEHNPFALMTRAELHQHVLRDCPVSSIVRCLSNLTSKGALLKTDVKRDGDCGRPVYCWKLNQPVTQADMFDAVLDVLP